MKIYTKKRLATDWQGAGILLVITVLMISYITSRKKTIVPSQSLDSVQQQHACKVVRKFFILSKNRYIDHKIITIIHKNQIIRNKKIEFITTLRKTMYHAPSTSSTTSPKQFRKT